MLNEELGMVQCVVPENIHTPTMEGFLGLNSPPLWKFQFRLIQWNLDLTKCQGTGEIGLVISRVHYIEVLFHTLHYYWAEKYSSLYRGLRYIEVR